MNAALERLVWQRAKSQCEYCQLPQAFSPLPHAIDHIIARQHHGPTQADNLAIACFFCNSYKGPNISGTETRTQLVALPEAGSAPRVRTWLGRKLGRS
jgi:5-methylcytosine-specific restriction endonuclease McrA